MMSSRGVSMKMAADGMVTKVCVTPEKVKESLSMQQKGECTNNYSPAVNGKMKFSFSCKKPRTTGEGEVVFSGDTSYKMKTKIVGETKADVTVMDASAKWLGADCGNIKPIGVPKAK
jgi:hypothetical protein